MSVDVGTGVDLVDAAGEDPIVAGESSGGMLEGSGVARVAPDDVGTVPWRGGWEAIAEHARALGPDPSLADVDDEGLHMAVRRAAGAQAAATARLLRLVAEFVARDLWVDLGMKSPGQWLSWALSVAPSTGREMVRVALALRTFTATAELFARGELSYSKVRAITRCGEPALEELLLQYADNAPASQLEKIVRSYRSLEDDRDPHGDRNLSTRHGARHVSFSVRVPVEVGLYARNLLDRIVKQLDAEGQPTDLDLPTGDNPDVVDDGAQLDPLGARRADAFVHALELAVDHLDRDLTGSARTTLVLEGDVDSTIDQLADTDRLADAEATDVDERARSLVETASAEAACERGDVPGGGRATAQDDRPGRPDARPPEPSRPPAPSVTVRDRGGGLLRLSRRVMRMLACDASLRRVATVDGTPVDVGRTQRLVTAKQLEALLVRDRGCQFPSCSATRHLHAHHVVHWADGGPTDLDNLVLLCGAHHRFIHAREWIVEAAPDGGWTFRAQQADGPMPPTLPMVPTDDGASAEAARHRDPFALQPAGWDGARLDLNAALDVMYQHLGRLPAGVRAPMPQAPEATCGVDA